MIGRLPCACGLLALTLTTHGQSLEPRWIPLDGRSQPDSPVQMRVLKSDAKSTTVEISVPGVWTTTQTYGGQTFTKLELPAVQLGGLGFAEKEGERSWYDFPAETGFPVLPASSYRNALQISVPKPLFPESALGKLPQTAAQMMDLKIDPAGARPGIPALRGFVAVSPRSTTADLGVAVIQRGGLAQQLSYPLLPAGFEGLDQTTQGAGYTAPPLVDKEFYAKFEGRYEGTETPVSERTGAGAFTAAEMRLPLVAVLNPHTIDIVTNIIVEFKHLAGPEDFDCVFGWDSWIFKLPFINGEALRESLTAKGIKIEASRSAHYLILTPKAYRAELNALALWKQSKGLTVDFAYVGTATGDDVAPDRNVIDLYLENYFKVHYCNGVYVLLVGDTSVIPSGRSTLVTAGPDGNDADSDHVYAVMGADRLASLYVGRLPVKSVEELHIQVGKILSYEKTPALGSWPLRATLAANSQNDDGTFYVSPSFPSKYAAAVNAIASYSAYVSPPTFQVLHAGASSAAAVRAVNQDVVDAINAGRGQVLYRGHGGGDGWVYGWDSTGVNFTTSGHIPLLSNTAFPIVYSIACQNSRLRDPNCIGVAWLNRSQGGAVAHFGASVNSNTAENHERAKGIFRAIYESGFTRLSPALGEAERISYSATGGGAGWDNNTFCYILLGDPELTIRRHAVSRNIAVAPFLTNLVNNIGTLIQVRDEKGIGLSEALVNVVLSNGSQLNGFTGAEGNLVVTGVSTDRILRLDIQADGYGAETYELPINTTTLQIERSGDGIVISWMGSGFKLENADNVIGPWTASPLAVTTQGGTNSIYTNIPLRTQFFRLR